MKLQSNSMTTGVALLCLAFPAAHAAEPPAAASADKPAAPATSAPAARPEPKLSTSAQPRANTSEARAPASSTAQAASKTPPARKSNDRIDLDTTTVSGNRELPKVLYIVPWKKADIGDLPAQPFNTLLDEVLTPVDRDVFRREVTYYGAIADGPPAEASGPAGSSRSSEK